MKVICLLFLVVISMIRGDVIDDFLSNPENLNNIPVESFLDLDNDNRATLSEVALICGINPQNPILKSEFAKSDKNSDGYLDVEEVKDFILSHPDETRRWYNKIMKE